MTQTGQANPNQTLGNNAADNITASFSYDQFGRRTNKTINVNGQANDVSYVYDGDQAVGETSSTANTSQLTGLAIDEHIARYTGQEQLIYLTDALGSIIAQTKADGSFQNKYGYSPYGQVVKDADDKGNPHQYTGRENDNTGLLFYRARYYMPSCGRFISEDRIGLNGGMNLYAYVGGDPVSFIDPSGEFGIPGMLGSFGFELGLQVLMNYACGRDLLDINISDLAAATVAGAFVPPGLAQLKRLSKINKELGAARELAKQLETARTLNRQQKLRQRIDDRIQNVLDPATNLAYGTTVKHSFKEAAPDWRPFGPQPHDAPSNKPFCD
jgi:RHS repeat-associated protein